MDIIEMKIKIIEQVLKIEDKIVLQQLLQIMEEPKSLPDKPWMKFAGTLNKEEAEQMIKDIE